MLEQGLIRELTRFERVRLRGVTRERRGGFASAFALCARHVARLGGASPPRAVMTGTARLGKGVRREAESEGSRCPQLGPDAQKPDTRPHLGSYFGQDRRVQARAIGDDYVRHVSPVLEVLEKTAHVVLIVGLHQGEGNREVAQGVGGQEQGAPFGLLTVIPGGGGCFPPSGSAILLPGIRSPRSATAALAFGSAAGASAG